MTTIYLIRHAEAEGNLYRIIQGQRDVQLTETGKLQAEALGERFRDIPVNAVYSSDLYRAAATAAAICRRQNLPLHRMTALREICMGSWEGRALGNIHRDHDAAGLNVYEKRNLRGGEVPEEVRDRMLEALQTIAAAHDGETVAVVSHGAAIRYVAAHLWGIEDSKVATGQNTAVSVLEAENGQLRMVSYDDASHLELWMEKFLGRPYHPRENGVEPGMWYRTPEGEERAAWLRAALALTEREKCPVFGESDVLLGTREEEPAGILALDPERDAEQGIGWVSVLWVKPELRCRTCGIQLLGQAVFRYREMGRTHLRLSAPSETARTFLEHNGFSCVAVGKDGCVMEKEIMLRPLEV